MRVHKLLTAAGNHNFIIHGKSTINNNYCRHYNPQLCGSVVLVTVHDITPHVECTEHAKNSNNNDRKYYTKSAIFSFLGNVPRIE